MTVVKICGLTCLEDALGAWECGADLLGFIFWPPSRRSIAPEKAAGITQTLRQQGCNALLVGVFVNQPLEYVRHVYAVCGLDLVQLHGDESPAYAAALGLPYLLARRVRDANAVAGLSAYEPWGFVLDAYDPEQPGGTGRAWAWEIFAHGKLPPRTLVAGGLTPENVRLALRTLHPWGVDVASGVEIAPGIKDLAKVEALIRYVREEDARAER